MGALPKQKVSRRRQGNRRRHIFIKPPTVVHCKYCGELRRSHHVCLNCGMYNGRQVIEIQERERRPE